MMNLKEEMLLTKKYHLSRDELRDVRSMESVYMDYVRRNSRPYWRLHFRDIILDIILKHEGIMGFPIREEERTNVYHDTLSKSFNRNAMLYFNDLTKADLRWTDDGHIVKEWIYRDGSKTFLDIEGCNVTTTQICSIDILLQYLESEDIKEGDKQLIDEYLMTGIKPDNLDLPCYEIISNDVKIYI